MRVVCSNIGYKTNHLYASHDLKSADIQRRKGHTVIHYGAFIR